MRERFDQRRVHGEVGIEVRGAVNAKTLEREFEGGRVGVESEGASRLDEFETSFVLAGQNLLTRGARGTSIQDGDRVTSVELRGHDLDGPGSFDAGDLRVGGDVFESHSVRLSSFAVGNSQLASCHLGPLGSRKRQRGSDHSHGSLQKGNPSSSSDPSSTDAPACLGFKARNASTMADGTAISCTPRESR